MTDVAALIADLVAAGTPAALVGRVAAALAAPSSDDELSADRRERDRIRKRIYREKSITTSADVPRNVPRTEEITPLPPGPLPDKEIPQTLLENNPSPLPPSPPKSIRGTRLGAGWALPKPMGDWALAQGLPRDRILLEAEKMRDWSINAGKVGVKVDWFAAWRNWVKKAIDELPRTRGSPGGRPLTGLAALTENFRKELENDGYGREGEEGSDPIDDARFPLLAGPNH